MSELSKSIDRLDALLLTIVGASFVVPTIAEAYGLDARLVWGPVVFYAGWIIFKAFLPTIILSYHQRAVIERMRGWSYVFSLGITLLGNYIMFTLLPRTIDVFITGVFVIALVLRLILVFVPKSFFRKEIIYMSKKQRLKIQEILKDTGSASIFFSIGVLTLSIEFMGSTEFSIADATLTLAIAFALFIYGVFRERKSSNSTHELAVSLINSGWYKRYSAKSKN